MCQSFSMTKKSNGWIDGHLQRIYDQSQALFACHTCIEGSKILGPNIGILKGNTIPTMGFLPGATPCVFP